MRLPVARDLALHVTLRCTRTGAARGPALHVICCCTRPHVAQDLSLHEAPCCTRPHVAQVLALHEAPCCPETSIAQGPTLHEAPCCTRPRVAQGPLMHEAPCCTRSGVARGSMLHEAPCARGQVLHELPRRTRSGVAQGPSLHEATVALKPPFVAQGDAVARGSGLPSTSTSCTPTRSSRWPHGVARGGVAHGGALHTPTPCLARGLPCNSCCIAHHCTLQKSSSVHCTGAAVQRGPPCKARSANECALHGATCCTSVLLHVRMQHAAPCNAQEPPCKAASCIAQVLPCTTPCVAQVPRCTSALHKTFISHPRCTRVPCNA